MHKLKALIFDVDGTLADTEGDGHRVAFNQAFAAAGLEWQWSPRLYEALLAITGGKERIRHYMDHYVPDFKPGGDEKAFIAELHRDKTRRYTEMLETGAIPLRPGVRRLLNEARAAGLRLAIATTTSPENVSVLLRKCLDPDAEAWFDVIAAGDIVPAKKPAPDIYEVALERLNLKPEECLAFEDSENGLKSSSRAGITTLVTVNDLTHGHDFSGARLVLDHLGEPDRPFKVLAGDARGAAYVNVELLKLLAEEACTDA